MRPTPVDSPEDTSGAPQAPRFAVLGLGRAGLAYAMAVARHREGALGGFVEPRTSLRRFARGAGFAAPACATLEQLQARQRCDAAIVTVPPEDRIAAIEAAVKGELAVLVDGLPVTHAEGASRLEGVIAGARAPVGCGIGLLFHPLFARAVSVIGTGVLGSLREIRASVYVSRVFSADSPPARGDVLDFAVGDLLVLLDAMFGPAAAVAATGQRLFGARLDEVHAQLRLANGREAGVDGSWSVPGYPRASLVIEVVGEHGGLLVSDDALEAELPAACEGLASGHSRRVLADELDPVQFECGDSTRPLAAFAAALPGGPLLDALDPRRALRVARLLDALRRSVAGGGGEREVTA
jgi:predicted dehydrogenase